jgi:glucan 1,3-beta-glucosidase
MPRPHKAFAYQSEGPFVKGAAPYIDKAIGWARSTGLKIIIDLHGAPQSQNGWEHSGHRVSKPGWGDAGSVSMTLSVLKSISKYAQKQYQDVVIAIELLNEPLISSLDVNTVRSFYTKGYNLVRGVSDTPVMLHDGFLAPSAWNGFLGPSSAKNVIVDHHEYQVFDNYLVGLNTAQHCQQVCSSTNAFIGTDKWEVVGEWSGAMTDCAVNLNGRGVGARYDGTFPGSTRHGSCAGVNSISQWSQTQKDNHRRYIETQLDYYEKKTAGWIFWNFKTEGSAEWDLYALIGAGVFPQPITARKFPLVCH